MRKQLEAVLDQYPVLTHEGHHVRHRGERHVVQQVQREVLGQAQYGYQSLNQLERHAGAAKHLEV